MTGVGTHRSRFSGLSTIVNSNSRKRTVMATVDTVITATRGKARFGAVLGSVKFSIVLRMDNSADALLKTFFLNVDSRMDNARLSTTTMGTVFTNKLAGMRGRAGTRGNSGAVVSTLVPTIRTVRGYPSSSVGRLVGTKTRTTLTNTRSAVRLGTGFKHTHGCNRQSVNCVSDNTTS